jgi:Tfp pilus assembly major pilin PilA
MWLWAQPPERHLGDHIRLHVCGQDRTGQPAANAQCEKRRISNREDGGCSCSVGVGMWLRAQPPEQHLGSVDHVRLTICGHPVAYAQYVRDAAAATRRGSMDCAAATATGCSAARAAAGQHLGSIDNIRLKSAHSDNSRHERQRTTIPHPAMSRVQSSCAAAWSASKNHSMRRTGSYNIYCKPV